MTRREQIEMLLAHYRDVCEGIYADPQGEDDTGRNLMCATWNHAAYQELERLLKVMHERWPRLRQAIRVKFERYEERRVAWCKKCGAHPAWHAGRIHSHPPGRSVALKPKVIRVYAEDDFTFYDADDAIEWLERHWQTTLRWRRVGDDEWEREWSTDIPKIILGIEAERSLRAA